MIRGCTIPVAACGSLGVLRAQSTVKMVKFAASSLAQRVSGLKTGR